MKICFLMRSEYESVHGGDVVQVQKYINFLEAKGYECHVHGRFPEDIEYFDLYIIVNIDRPIELIIYYSHIKSKNKPYLIIPIHHPTDAITKFEQKINGGTSGLFSTIFPSFYTREKFKDLYRVLKGRHWYIPYIIKNLLTSYIDITRKIIRGSSGLLCISNQEATSIGETFNCSFDYEVLINAVDIKGNICDSNIEREYDIAIVGRIEPRKNQLLAAKALLNSGLKTLFIGQLSDPNNAYCRQFVDLVDGISTFTFTGKIPQQEVFNLLSKSKLLLNCSYFEVSPLVDIEAAVCGCRVVSTLYGYSRGNIEDLAVVDPFDESSIFESCRIELKKFPEKHIINREVYSWDYAGQRLVNFIDSKINKVR